MDEQALKARLPNSIIARVQSLKLAEGRVTLVLDASGLDEAERSGIDAAIKEILGEADGVEDVRVAMTADRALKEIPREPRIKMQIVAVGSGKGGGRKIDADRQSRGRAKAAGQKGWRG